MTTETEGGERRRGGVAADRIRILIVDDHALFRVGIANILSREREFDVVGEAAEGRSALEMAGMTSPNIVLMDLSLPAPGGLETTQRIRREYPAIAHPDVVSACVAAAAAAGAGHHLGIIRSVDALYSDLVPSRMPRREALEAELLMWSRAGVVANDMESSTIMVVSSLRKLRAGVILLCVDELGAGEIHHLDPAFMDRMLRVAVDAVRRLILSDAAARQ